MEVSYTPCLRAASGHLCLLHPGAQSPCLHYRSHGTVLLWHCKLPALVPWLPCQLPTLPIAETPQPPFSHFVAELSQAGRPAEGLSPWLAWWSQRGSSVPSAQAGPEGAGCPCLVLATCPGPGPPDAARTVLIPRRRARALSLTFPLLLPCLQPLLPPAALRGLGCLSPSQCEAGHPATAPLPQCPSSHRVSQFPQAAQRGEQESHRQTQHAVSPSCPTLRLLGGGHTGGTEQDSWDQSQPLKRGWLTAVMVGPGPGPGRASQGSGRSAAGMAGQGVGTTSTLTPQDKTGRLRELVPALKNVRQAAPGQAAPAHTCF